MRIVKLVGLAAALLALPSAARAQGGPPPEVRRAIDRLREVLSATDDASIESFRKEALSEGFRGRLSATAFTQRVRAMRTAVRGKLEDIDVRRGPDGDLLVEFGGPDAVGIRVRLDDAFLIDDLELAP